jgi:hypothetical protein
MNTPRQCHAQPSIALDRSRFVGAKGLGLDCVALTDMCGRHNGAAVNSRRGTLYEAKYYNH